MMAALGAPTGAMPEPADDVVDFAEPKLIHTIRGVGYTVREP